MVRFGLKGLAALLLGGCGGEHSAIQVRIEADADGATVQCVDSTSGMCHVALATAASLRGELRKGESRQFAGVAPGTPMCIEAESVDLTKCNRTAMRQGTQKIVRNRRVD
jgi:hypothetical protein